MQKIKLTIAYDGTDFHGFQAQTRRDATIRTVQSVLEESLERVTGHPVPVTGAGRTDAGVHAKAQVVTFESAGAVPVERWPRVLNHRLPRDVVVISARSVPLLSTPVTMPWRKYTVTLLTRRPSPTFSLAGFVRTLLKR